MTITTETSEAPVWLATADARSASPSGRPAIRIEGVRKPWSDAFVGSRTLVVGDSGPVGWLHAEGGPPTAAAVEEMLRMRPSSRPGARRVDRAELSASIVVCTRDRPVELRRFLDRLAKALPSDMAPEVVIVDNAPTTDETAEVVRQVESDIGRLRLVTEPRPGLSRARNAGLAAATGEVIVFLDDDTLPAPGWFRPLVRALTDDPDAAVATGLVPPAELETDAQHLFESRLHWSEAFDARRFHIEDVDSLPGFPFITSGFGTGANMAVRRSAILDLGGFDVHLGAGTAAKGGEDLEIFVRTLHAGRALLYVPESVVWHVHARDLDTVRRNVFNYGVGESAFLTSLLLGRHRWDLLRSVPEGVRHFARKRGEMQVGGDGSTDSSALTKREALGLLWGPVAYGRQRWRSRREEAA